MVDSVKFVLCYEFETVDIDAVLHILLEDLRVLGSDTQYTVLTMTFWHQFPKTFGNQVLSSRISVLVIRQIQNLLALISASNGPSYSGPTCAVSFLCLNVYQGALKLVRSG